MTSHNFLIFFVVVAWSINYIACQCNETSPCEPTTFCNNKTNSCDLCKDGYMPNEGLNGNSTDCVRCPSGQYSSPTTSKQFFCRSCTPGSYPKKEQSSCVECEAGSYCEKMENCTSCTSCPAGKYQQYNGALNCIKCGSGSYAPNMGSADCPMCPAGYYCPDACTVLPCPDSYYCPGGSGIYQSCKVMYKPSNDASTCEPTLVLVGIIAGCCVVSVGLLCLMIFRRYNLYNRHPIETTEFLIKKTISQSRQDPVYTGL